MEKLQIPEYHNIPIYQREHFEKSACAIEGRNGLTPVYQGWFPKQRHYWNGWACPAFLTRKSFLEFTKRQFGDYDASNDDDFLIEYHHDYQNEIHLQVYSIAKNCHQIFLFLHHTT